MIDEEEINEVFEESLLDEANASAYLFENKKLKENPVFLYSLNIEGKIVDLVKKFSNNHLKSIINLINKNSLDSIPLYNPDDQQDVFKIDSKKVELFQQIYDIMVNTHLYARFRKEDVDEEKIKAWIFRFEMVIDDKIEQMLLFQRFLATKMCKSRGVPIYETDREFKLFESNIYCFYPIMDFVYYKDTFIVENTYSFEKIFGYEEYYKESACNLVEEFDENKIPDSKISIQFEDKDDVISKIQSNTMLARKIFAALSNGSYKELDFDKLIDLNKRYGFGLHLDRVKKQWMIDRQLDLTTFARILNDEYNRSQITPYEYVVSKKVKIIK